MYQPFYVLVTVHAGKHAAVDGVFQALAVNKQADLLAVDLCRQGVVAVAGEAVFVCQLMFGAGCSSAQKKRKEEGLYENFSSGIHSLEEIPRQDSMAVTGVTRV